MTLITDIRTKLFGHTLDFRIRLFNILALGGVIVSLFTVLISITMEMWQTAAVAAFLVVLSISLILFTQKTGKYRIAYHVTIVTIFMIFIPMMFFTSGGHRSGMPTVFLFAVLFTVLMLDGKNGIFISFLEIAEYAAVFVFAYLHPEYVTHFDSEVQVLIDVIFANTCVSLICGVVLYFHLKEYDRQREQLRIQNEKLTRYDASRLTFLTTVSHEIKNPLNAINLHAHDTIEMMDEAQIDTQEIKKNQQIIENMVRRIDRILMDLKDTVAIEQGRLSLSLAPLNLEELLVEISETYFGKNNTSGNKLVLDLEHNLPLIEADYARLTQVVTNLLSNAIQHTKNGVITISLYKKGNEQIAVVSDNGEGMSEDLKKDVFHRYVSSGEEYWRHGIGLYVCNQIIEAHGGRIWLESRLNQGTSVAFTLPDKSG